MDIAAGEYGYSAGLFREHARRQGGGLPAGRRHALRRRHGLSARGRLVRGASSRHIRPLRAVAASACGLRGAALRHLEWFHDHVRIEQMLFDGAPVAKDGTITPDLSRPGHGLDFRAADAARYATP